MKAREMGQARKLRESGESIKQIAIRLGVSVSSVSFWVKDIQLTDEQKVLLNNRQVTSRWIVARKSRENAARRHTLFKQEGYLLAKRSEEFRLISALYWGEGGKSLRTKHFRLSNSDETMIGKVFNWLSANGYSATLRVAYYEENGISEQAIEGWWRGRIPDLKNIQFGKSKISRASQKKGIGKLLYGTATLVVCSTKLFFMMLGGISFIAGR